MTTQKEIDRLRSEHSALYAELLPTLKTYSDMASRALGLQEALYRELLAQAWPEAVFSESVLALSIEVRDSPGHVEAALRLLTEKHIQVKEIIFDPAKLTFHLYV